MKEGVLYVWLRVEKVGNKSWKTGKRQKEAVENEKRGGNLKVGTGKMAVES